MKIYAPVKTANGVYASVRFVDGVGETDNPRLIEWFQTHGYKCEKCEELAQNSREKCENDDKTAKMMNPMLWKSIILPT